MSLLHEQKSFLETNAWQKPNINSLRYNTSQVGSVIPIVYGTTRLSINLIGLGEYRGPGGKKGKSNVPLPIGGTRPTAKGKGLGGGSKKGTGGKKSENFSIDVAFALCQGPVDILDENKVWASAGIAFFQSVGLNLYTGEDGQAADPVFAALGQDDGYSGTCYVTGTPMDLGGSPVLPNLSFEMTGFETGTGGTSYGFDANPANVVEDFLTNLRYGAGWPSANLDPDIATPGSNNYGDYCQAALFAISPALQSQTEAATWISELAKLTNTAIVWSGSILKFIPYGDLALSRNGAEWEPNLTPLYSLTDDDFLPWSPHIDVSDPQLGEDDPVIVTRSNPADATNWMSIEYLDRENDYNKTVIPEFDQGHIDLYGVRTEPAVQGSCFCERAPAENSLRLLLQRSLYVRNTYRFQLGWQYALLEPMDIVLLTDVGIGLNEQPVRIIEIEENENGDLIILAEEIVSDGADVTAPTTLTSIYVNAVSSILFNSGRIDVPNGPQGTFSVLIYPEDQDTFPGDDTCAIFRELPLRDIRLGMAFGIGYNRATGQIAMSFGGPLRENVCWAWSDTGIISADARWHNLICSWDMNTFEVQCCYDGVPVPLTVVPYDSTVPFDCYYEDCSWGMFSASNYVPIAGRYYGGVQDVYFNVDTNIDLSDSANVKKFWDRGRAKRLGANGEIPTGSPPAIFLHYDGEGSTSEFATNYGTEDDGTIWHLALGTFDSNPYGE